MRHTTSKRGFKSLEPIRVRGGRLRIFESSSAMRPEVWLKVESQNGDHTDSATIGLSLLDIDVLVKQLQWIAEHHYQVERDVARPVARPEQEMGHYGGPARPAQEMGDQSGPAILDGAIEVDD